MKKIGWLGIMMFVLMSASVFGATVSIPNTNVNPGTTTVQIPINIDNANSIAGFQFTVTFDNSVLNATGAVVGSLTNGWLLQVNPQAGQISVIGASSTALGSVSGSLSILQFNVVGNPADTTNLTFTVHKLSDFNAQQIAHTATNGTFHINGYSISGKVTLSGGTGKVTDTVLTLTQVPAKATTKPDTQGNYSFTDLPRGTYTITPQLSGYAFNPVNRQVVITNANITGQNFTGNALASVSGTISYSGTQSGAINIGLFTSSNFTGEPAYGTQISSVGTYNIAPVAPGTYYAAAYMDTNADNQWQQATEPSGSYSGNPFTLTAGQQKTGVNITLKEPLTLTVNSAFGSPNPSVGQHTYYTGDSITASVVSPVAGTTGIRYVCTGWTGTGNVPATGSTTSTTFTINQNSSITWNWKTQYLLTYSADPAAGGNVTVNPIATGNWYDENTPVQLTATPNANYVFLHWLLDGNIVQGDRKNANPVLDITMNQPHNAVAVFALNQPVLGVEPTSVQFYFNPNVDSITKETGIIIKNAGSGPGTLEWQIDPAKIVYQQGDRWINIQQPITKNNVIQGSLPAGNQEIIILQVNRTGYQEGEYNATVPVTSNGGNTNIQVKMIINQPPTAEALRPSDETEIETAVYFEARFANTGGTVARSEWKIYYLPPEKQDIEIIKTISLKGDGNKIILPFSMFSKENWYLWTVQCWDSYGEASNIAQKDFKVIVKANLPPASTVNANQTGTIYLPDSTTTETAVTVTLESTEGKMIIRPLIISEFPGANSVFANLFDIRVEGITPGSTAIIEFEIPGSYSSWGKYEYDNEASKWVFRIMPSNSTTSPDNYAVCSPSTTKPGYTKVELKLKDGGDYDFDGNENGIISDPSGSVSGAGGITKVSGGGGGCFIATAAFGSYQEHHVWILRQFRDNYLLTNPAGRAFVRWYYLHSPRYASIIAQSAGLRAITRIMLMPIYALAFATLKFGALFWIFAAGILLSIFARRMRVSRKSILFIVALSFIFFASPSFAYDFNLFKPSIGEQNFTLNHSSQTLQSGRYQFDAFYSFGNEISEAKIAGKKYTLIEDQHLLIVGLSYGISDRFTISADIPVVLNQDTELPARILDIEDNGIGNISIYGKYKFFGGKDQLGMAIVPFVGFNTGDEENFITADSTVVGVKLVIDRNWCNHSFLTFNIGASHQDSEKIGQIKINNALLFGLGFTQLLPNEKTYATIEIVGRSDDGFFDDEEKTPIEALGSITHTLGKNTKWTTGIGTSITEGYSAPNFRIFTGVRMGF